MEDLRLEWEGDRRILIDLMPKGRLRTSTTLEVNLLLEDTLLLATITQLVSTVPSFIPFRTKKLGESREKRIEAHLLLPPLSFSPFPPPSFSDYQDPQADYQQNSYPPQPQDSYYNPQLQPQSPPQQPYIDPYAQNNNAYASSSVPLAAGAWNQQQQQQPYIPPTSPQQQQRYASPSNAYSSDPRSAMQHNFASPPPVQPQLSPQPNDAYATDAYGGYASTSPYNPGPSPASPANVYAPSPQRLVQQHPVSLTPGGGHDLRGDPSGTSSGSGVYYDASTSQGASGSGGGGAVVEPPSYELSSMAPGQTDVMSGSGFPREKGGYQPGAGR